MAQRQMAGRLVGRSVELATVAGLLGRAAYGHGGAVVVEGEAGIGKTRLLDEVFDQDQQQAFTVFRAAADVLEQRRPFGVVVESLQVHNGVGERRIDIARLLRPEPVSPDAPPVMAAHVARREFAVVDAMVSLVEESCALRPVAMVIEDVQWADPLSLVVLQRLASAAQQLPLLMLVTARLRPRTLELDRLVRVLDERGATTIRLGPLDGEEVTALAHEVLGASPGARLRRYLDLAGGNPLFVVELIRSLGEVEVAAAEAAPTLPMTILRGLSILPSDALDLLRVASILGSRFTAAELAAVTNRPTGVLVEPLRACLDSGVLAPVGTALAFRHDVIRETLYQDLPKSVRSALHADAARVLRAAGAPTVRVAEHLMRGASAGDTVAVSMLHKAAREVAVTAPAVAVDLLERAVELGGPSHPARTQMLSEQIVNLMWAGRVSESQAMGLELLGQHVDPAVEDPLRLCLAMGLSVQGRATEALEHFDRASASPQLSAADRALAMAWAAHTRWASGDLEGAVATAQSARALAEDACAGTPLSIALAALAAIQYVRGRFLDGVRLAEDAVAHGGHSGGAETQGFQLHLILATCLLDADRHNETADALKRGRQISGGAGSVWKLGLYDMIDGLRLYWTGSWDDAVAHLEAGVQASDEMGTGHTIMACSLRALIALHRDQLPTAERWLQRAEEELAVAPAQYRSNWVAWVKALLAEARDDRRAAVRNLRAGWELCTGLGLGSEYAVVGPDLVRLSLDAGEPDHARDVAKVVEEVAALNPGVATVEGAALRCRGLVEGRAELLLASVAAYRKGGRPFQAAVAAEDAALMLARVGRSADARPSFAEACSVYEELGASRALGRAESRLRPFGLRRGRRGARNRPATGWPSLTTTEEAVAALVAEGLSNPEIGARMFLSRRTVQTHVSHILSKLGLTSRVEVAAEAARRTPQGLP